MKALTYAVKSILPEGSLTRIELEATEGNDRSTITLMAETDNHDFKVGQVIRLNWDVVAEPRKAAAGHKGFSLIELLIVVAIVLIIAAIAIPNLLKAKQTADASGAVGTMRTINSALQIYAATYGDYPTTPALASTELACPASGAASSVNACLLDAATAAALGGTGTRNHYSWTYTYTAGTGGAASAFTVLAAPGTGLTQSVRQFLLDQSGIIRFADGAAPTSTSSPM